MSEQLSSHICTRKHSSRMRTVRCSDRRGGVSAQGGCTCPGEVLASGRECVSQHALRQTPPRRGKNS